MANPKSIQVSPSTRQARRRLSSLNLHELNQVLEQLGRQLDAMSGIGQDIDMKGRKIVNLAIATAGTDAVPLEQIDSPTTMTFSTYWKEFLFMGGSGIG